MGPCARRLAGAARVAALLLLSGCTGGSSSATVGPGAIGMDGNVFGPDARTVKVGERLTFVNDSSHSLHILAIGDRAVARHEEGAPDFGGPAGVRTDPGESWQSPAWEVPGTFHVTCTVHPRMNMEVTVTA